MRRSIEWKKWVDPLLSEENLSQEYGSPVQLTNYRGPYMAGPFGIIPLAQHNLASALYDFWVGHANFDVGQEEQGLIERVEGVEVLKVFTRYRFWMGVGLQFGAEAVKQAVEDAVCTPPPAPLPPPVRSPAQVALAARFPHWALVRMENGKTQCVGGDTAEAVKEKVEKMAGKTISSSWGEK